MRSPPRRQQGFLDSIGMSSISQCCEAIGSCLSWAKRTCNPITSLMTAAVVSYISYVYVWHYYPWLATDSPFSAFIQTGIFIIFPTLIFWSLFQLLRTDPGFVTKKLLSETMARNGINEN